MTDSVLVIGSNSFSGASFCRWLLTQGANVIGISRSTEPQNCFLPYTWAANGQFEFKQLDLNHHLPEIETLLNQCRPKIVYNFAAQSMVGQSWDIPEHWFMTNCVSTIKLHNILRKKDFLDKYVHVSTPEVYGSCEGFVYEDHQLDPSTPYAVSRAATDMSLKTYFDVHGFPVVTTRAANVVGPGQQLYRIVPKTIFSILKGIKLPLHGGGHSRRSFIHIDDVANATQLIGEQGACGEVYHISTTRIVSIRDLVTMICEQLGKKIEDVCDISDDRKGKDAAYLLDSSKVRTELGWQDQISLENTIDQCVTWSKNNFDTITSLPLEYVHKA
jgi:dTDP-glucose 4,6-dehydratase